MDWNIRWNVDIHAIAWLSCQSTLAAATDCMHLPAWHMLIWELEKGIGAKEEENIDDDDKNLTQVQIISFSLKTLIFNK